VDPRHLVLDGGSDHPMTKGRLVGEIIPIAKYRNVAVRI